MNVVRKPTHQAEIDPNQYALSAVRGYSDNTVGITGSRRDYLHPQETAEIMKDFSIDIFPPPAFDAALLHDLPDRIKKPRFEDAARLALQEYFSNVDEGTVAYTACLLGDMGEIEKAAEKYRGRVKDEDKKYVDAVTNGTRGSLPPEYWLKDAAPVDTNSMLRTLRRTNLEASAVKAAESVANISVPPPREAALLQDVLEAESFYAPLLKFIKLDGFAMALNSAASLARLRGSNNTESIDFAAAQLSRASSEYGLSNAFIRFFGDENNYSIGMANTNNSGLDIAVGDIVANIGKREVSGRWRRKSLGSTAWKTYKKDGFHPDIVAMTLFAEDEGGAAEILRDAVSDFQRRLEGVDENSNTPGYTRVTTSIRGDDDYVDTFERTVGGLKVEAHKADRTGKGSFKLAKAIFRPDQPYTETDVPTLEIQVVTEEQRFDNRFGRYMHAGYKGKVEGKMAAGINARRDRVRTDTLEVNGQSKKRGAAFLKKDIGLEVSPELSALLS